MADAIRKCDTFYEAGDYDEAYAEIMKAQEDPNPEVRWRIVRMTFKGILSSNLAKQRFPRNMCREQRWASAAS